MATFKPIPIGPSHGAILSITSLALEKTSPNLFVCLSRNYAALSQNPGALSNPSSIFSCSLVALSILLRTFFEIAVFSFSFWSYTLYVLEFLQQGDRALQYYLTLSQQGERALLTLPQPIYNIV